MERAELLRRVTAALEELEYSREGESEKHLRDIAGVIKVTGEELDDGYIIAPVPLSDRTPSTS